MDEQRAQEIVGANAMIQVHYYGIPVYIQEVHEKEGMATVFPLDNMDHVQLVDIEGLTEIPLMPLDERMEGIQPT